MIQPSLQDLGGVENLHVDAGCVHNPAQVQHAPRIVGHDCRYAGGLE